MKKKILLILFLFIIHVVDAQQKVIDSLRNIISKQRKDTTEANARSAIAWAYIFINPDSAIIMAKEARDLARELNFSEAEINSLSALGEALRTTGDFPQALEADFNALRIGREIKNKEMESTSLIFIGFAYIDLGEYRQALNYLYRAKEINDKSSLKTEKLETGFLLSNIGHAYEKLGKRDSALFFQEQAQILYHDLPPGPGSALILTRLGVIQADLGNQAQALSYYRQAIQIGDLLNLGVAQYRVAELFYTLNQPDSSLHYARLALISNQKSFQKTWVLETSNLLVKLYKEKNIIDSAFHYQELSMTLNNNLFGPEKFHRLQLLAINEQQQQQKIIQRQKEIQQEKERSESKIKLYALLAIIGIFLLLAITLYRNNRQKQIANSILHEQKQKVESALSELKSTQSQLIQSEKMASLGELTAGIAHEIQNPLNFVNNFSEVNTELLEELKNEKLKVKNERDDQLETELINDIVENEKKINHHGKRADAIVKGMLQHSQTSSGVKEPTDINKLADEYLNLAYHGLRGKDKSFNAALIPIAIGTDFDETIGNINIIPQDIGRVLLNLYNNAFYAASLPSKGGFSESDNKKQPTITVSTSKTTPSGGRGAEVLISVRDNGPGIPQKVVDKIFQPFFTTKPTGQGTGLGLSLAYDIIKAHGGEINVRTKEGEGSEFIIQLPAN